MCTLANEHQLMIAKCRLVCKVDAVFFHIYGIQLAEYVACAVCMN